MDAMLRLLTLLAGIIILLGGVLLLMHAGSAPTAFHVFSEEPGALLSVTGIVAATLHGNVLALIQLGILLLVAMPVARVLVVGICFCMERDWLYVGVAAVVLVILCSSLAKH